MKFRVTRPFEGYPDTDTVIEAVGFIQTAGRFGTVEPCAVYVDADGYIRPIPWDLLRVDPAAFVPTDC